MKILDKSFKVILLSGLLVGFGWSLGPEALAQTQQKSYLSKAHQGAYIQKARSEASGGRYQRYHSGYRSSDRWQGSHRPYYHRDWHRHHHHYGWRWYYYPSWWYGWPGYYYYYYPWNPWWYW
ncbi:MAG: hypothetical protein WHX93_07025 [bacterium]